MKLKNVSNIISEVNHYGVTNNHLFLDEDETNFLSNKCKTISRKNKIISYLDVQADSKSVYENDYSVKNFFQAITTNIIGVDEELDIFFNKIFNNKEVNAVLEKFTGKNYILNNLSMRYMDSNSKFVGWHQDDPNAFSLVILLNDIEHGSATTTFIKGSHMFKYNFGKSMEKINPKYFKKISHRATGNKGEVYFFSNAAIHGVQVGSASTVIICCFLPEEYNNKKQIFPKRTLYNKDYNIVLNNELGRLFNFNEIKTNNHKSETALKKNKFIKKNLNLNLKFLFMYIFLVLLSAALTFLKFIYSIFKK